jgi:hypothetical protein
MMLPRAFLSISLLIAIPALSQVVPSATGPAESFDDEYRMPIPPMVSGQAFPISTLAETRTNYLNAGVTFQSAYYDNLLPDYGTHPISDFGYSITPTLQIDQLTPRFHQTLDFRPGFTLYQRTSARNEADQTASYDLQYRLSPHMTLSGQDSFQKISNVFNQPDSLLGAPVSGAPPSSPADVIAPYADRLSNAANGEFTYQFSRDAMIGGGGTTALSNYLDQPQSTGLYNSHSWAGSTFYSRRLAGSQYLGATYQYMQILGNPSGGQLEIQLNTVFAFYTAFLAHRLSLSLAAGPQHFALTFPSLAPSASWTPAVTGSLGWQAERTSLSASYSRSISGGGGLIGAFNTNSASGSARWQWARTWGVGATGGYTIFKNVSPVTVSSEQGGHTVTGTVSVDHTFNERFRAEAGYQRLHQSYNGIAAISSDPDGDRGFISITYQLTKSLGR